MTLLIRLFFIIQPEGEIPAGSSLFIGVFYPILRFTVYGGTIKKSHQFREECGFSRIAGVRSHIDHPGNTLRLV